MQTRNNSVPEDGRWLSTEGPYRNFIAAWCELNPNLRNSDSKNLWTPLRKGDARVAMLELKQGKQICRSDFSSAADLSAHLQLAIPGIGAESPSTGRIYIMEGLATD